jgi:hypothetical protein
MHLKNYIFICQVNNELHTTNESELNIIRQQLIFTGIVIRGEHVLQAHLDILEIVTDRILVLVADQFFITQILFSYSFSKPGSHKPFLDTRPAAVSTRSRASASCSYPLIIELPSVRSAAASALLAYSCRAMAHHGIKQQTKDRD